MKQYGIKDTIGFQFIKKDTNEVVFEGKGLSNENNQLSVEKSEKKLIPFKMSLNDNFEMTIYVDEETAKRLYEFGKSQIK